MPLCSAADWAVYASVALSAEYRFAGLLYCMLTGPAAAAGCEPRNGRAERLYLLPMFWNSCTEALPDVDDVVQLTW